jgi:multiple sugar transport system permease protein
VSARLSGRRLRLALPNALAYSILVVGVLAVAFPIGWMVSTSFKDSGALFAMPPQWIPLKPVLEAYGQLFSADSSFLTYYRNSIVVCGLATLLALQLGAPAAYALSRFRLRGRNSILIFVLSSQMFPVVLLLLGMFRLFRDAHALNNMIALAVAYTSFALPFSIWMLRNYFETVPAEIEEAALIDGCTRLSVLWRVLVPITRPAFISVGVFTFLVGWNELLFALTLTSTDDSRTIPAGLVITFQGQYQISWAAMMAASLLVSVPIIAIFIFLQRYVVQGLTLGAVRG